MDSGIFKVDPVRKGGEHVPKWTCPGILQLFSSNIFCKPCAFWHRQVTCTALKVYVLWGRRSSAVLVFPGQDTS